jgi:hypothetical protein
MGMDRTAEGRAATASLLILTCDAKGIVVRKQDLRPQTRKAAEKKQQHKLRTQLTKGEKRNRKRMATVAAVYTVAAYIRTPEQAFEAVTRQPGEGSEQQDGERAPRPRPVNKRVWASLERTPSEVLDDAFREAQVRDRNHEMTWVVVVDGSRSQLDLLEKAAAKFGVAVTIVLDLMHVLRYLWKAGHCLYPESSAELEGWVLERLLRILEGRAVHVAAGIRRSATRRGLSKSKRVPVDTCADYLLKYKRYLAYDRYLAAGFPITSGVIEGACRHLVKDRLDITGARWSLAGAEAVLRLRALRSSHDFDEYWRFHEECERTRNHRVKYAGGHLPPLQQPGHRRPHMRLVE